MRSIVTDQVAFSVSVGLSVTVVSPAKTAEAMKMPFRIGTSVGPRKRLRWGCTLAPPVEYHYTIRVQRRCGLLSDYFDHLLNFCISKTVLYIFFEFV